MQHFKPVPERSQPNITPLRILIVDADLRSQFELSLSAHPQLYLVGTVTHGRASLEVAQQLKPDLIILNPPLPDINSIVVLQTLKKLLPSVRVLITSSDCCEQSVSEALMHGANAYCAKDISQTQLLMAIACIQDGAVYLDSRIARSVINQLERSPGGQPITTLTSRELEVLRLIVAGQTNVEIGKTLYLSPSTVKCHVRNIMNKLAVNDRVQVAVRALRSGLVESHVA